MAHLNTDIFGLILSAKRTQNARKAQWESFPMSGALDWAAALPEAQLRSGETGIWNQPILIDPFGQTYSWLILDVEAAGEHGNLEANIAAAQATLAKLEHLGLADEVQVFLSGRGFRFAWPYVVDLEWGKAFLAFLKDRENWPALDPAPHLYKAHFRLFAFRGHWKQGKPLPVHVHRLATPGGLFELTAQGYQALVAGHGDPEQWLSWYEAMLPRMWLPEPWRAFLAHYQRGLQMQELIISPPWSKPKSRQGVDWSAIHEQLRNQGISYRETTAGGYVITKLARCPVCGQRDGSPYLTQVGRLRDFRQTCPASKASGGLPPSGWVPDYQGADEEPVFIESPAGKSLAEVRDAIKSAVRDEGDKLIRTSPGSGKTYTSIEEAIELARTQRVLYTAPTHQLAEEVLGLAQSLAGEHLPIRLIKGRNEENCSHNEEAQRHQAKGFPPALTLCPQCLRETEQTGRSLCAYRQQFEALPETGLFISTHDQAATILLATLKPGLWLVDENPRRAMLSQVEIDFGALLAIKARLPEPTAKIVGRMLNAPEELLRQIDGPWKQGRLYATAAPPDSPWNHQLDLWEAARIDPEAREHLGRDLAVLQQLRDESMRAWFQRISKQHISPNAISWLQTAVESGIGSAYTRVRQHDRNPITFHLVKRQGLADLSPETRLVLLDGTGDLAEAEALFGRTFDLVEAGVAVSGCRKVWIQRGLGKVRGRKLSDSQIRSRLKELLVRLKPNDRRVLIVTHKDIEARVAAAARELNPGREFEVTHYWANRGLNLYKDCHAVICFGTPSVNPLGVFDEAMALFPDSSTREKWIAKQGESDLEQSIHRIRPINGGKTIIAMGRNWPASLGQPDIHINQRRKGEGLLAAVERLTLFATEFGFLNKDAATMLGVLVRGAAEDAGAGVISLPERCPDRIKGFFNRVGTPTEGGFSIPVIRLPGNSAWSNVLAEVQDRLPYLPSLSARLGSARNQWTKALGTLVAVRRFCALIGFPYQAENWQGVEWVIVSGLPLLAPLNNRGRVPGQDSYGRYARFTRARLVQAHRFGLDRPPLGTSGGLIITGQEGI